MGVVLKSKDISSARKSLKIRSDFLYASAVERLRAPSIMRKYLLKISEIVGEFTAVVSVMLPLYEFTLSCQCFR